MSASSKKKFRKEQAAETMTERQQQAKKEAKSVKTYTWTFVIIMVLVVCIALGTVVSQAVARSGIVERHTNAVTINDHTLTSAQLNYYFVDAVNREYSSWYSSYGNMTSMYVQLMYGLNLSQPLSKQAYSSSGDVTWGDFFASAAVADARSTYALYDLAMADNYELTAEEKENLETSIKNNREYAIEKYGSFGDYLKGIYGPGATEETFEEYMLHNTIAQSYYNAHSESLVYEDADLRKYEKDHFDEFSSFSFSSFYMNNNDFLTGGTKDEDGKTTYSDEERAQAAKDAEAAVKELEKTEINTAVLLDKAISLLEPYKDNESAVTSKNKDVLYSKISEKIVEWLADDTRKAGDFTAIPNISTSKDEDGKETSETLGYYLVVFEGRNDNTMQLVNVRHILSAFQGGTKNDEGKLVYSEAEQQKALDKLNKVKDLWLAGEHTEESFAALVEANTDDPGSKTTGGLYENVYPGQTLTEFDAWCFDKEHKPGDYEVVKTDAGQHLIYFVGYSDTNYRDFMIDATLRKDAMSEWYAEVIENAKVSESKTSHLSLDLIIAPNY